MARRDSHRSSADSAPADTGETCALSDRFVSDWEGDMALQMLKCALIGLTLGAAAFSGPSEAEPTESNRPNILVIMADDIGYRNISADKIAG
ncbi:hypothetical protein [Candidatus Rhodoblastus alkanivorans]|uniref:hypothetical protein n=1 Tax=Candidatus Rhodoblastus alkanivorans TaxID=2954117 RepID=UPI003CC8B11E